MSSADVDDVVECFPADRVVVCEFVAQCVDALGVEARSPEEMAALTDQVVGLGLRLATAKKHRSFVRTELYWFYCGPLRVVENGKCLDELSSWKAKTSMLKRLSGAAGMVLRSFCSVRAEALHSRGPLGEFVLNLADCAADLFLGRSEACSCVVVEELCQPLTEEVFFGKLLEDLAAELKRPEVVALWYEVPDFVEPADGRMPQCVSVPV
jgi:hypothetical protein